MTSTPRIAVLIPCHNEEATIAQVVADFRQALPEAAIYVYDNCSTDATAAVARAAGATVRTEPRKGKGYVVRSMMRDVEADCYLLVDGDNTYPACHAPALCAEVLAPQPCDMVIGDRLSPPTSPRTSVPCTARATAWCAGSSTAFSIATYTTS